MSGTLQEIIEVQEESTSLDEKKLILSSVIYKKMKENEISIRKLAKNIDGMGAAQISRVLHAENYNIMTILKILDYFDLELDIKNK
ncbi:hypothetical protein P4V41_10910 [Fictibacillus nanhaiensis]|uniref:hypothetical protein n=1 Tax=Fictibacillus nanhaiensis TaxID=742169 RepID=UPI002E1A1858|nr:hypothetical protein [Fictibacillus nanhaiensis]